MMSVNIRIIDTTFNWNNHFVILGYVYAFNYILYFGMKGKLKN